MTSPIFDRITIYLSAEYHSGKAFVIETEGNGPGERCMQSVEINGATWDKPWFPHKLLTAGGTLRMTLGKDPNKVWGARPEDAPPR
ncbi:MAG: glycoside hydrolase family 92 protein [Anaerolineae bacterium]|nr:glycoside hydrolase family 92 protein [Anaerolineae bacterium]